MSITDKRKLVLVFMVSALLCILAFKAIGQDTTQIGAKPAHSVKYCYLTITTIPPKIDSFLCPDLGFMAHPMPQDTIGIDTSFTKLGTGRVIPASDWRDYIILRDPAWSLDGSAYGIREGTPLFSPYRSITVWDTLPPDYFQIGEDHGVPVNINGLKRLPQIDPDPSTLKLIWTDIKKYKPYGQGRVINFTLSTLSGIAWGTHEAIYADATILEKRFGFSKYSWGGSNAWESKYPGGKYEEGEHPILWKDKTNLFREAKKSTAFLGRYGAIVVAINISRKEKVHWLDYVINSALYTGSALVTYNYLR